MRVLTLAHNFPRHAGDPVGSFVLRLAVALARHDIEVLVVAPAAADLPQDDIIEGVRVHRFRYAPRRMETLAYTGTMGAQVGHSWGARLAMLGFLGAGYRAAIRQQRAFRADVVHAHWWFPGGLVARALHSRARVPYVITMHGSDIRLAGSVPGATAFFRSVSRHAEATTTVSSWLAGEARRLDPGVEPVVAPMPVVAGLFEPGGTRDHNRLLFIGKLAEQKGLHHLLRAMSLMRARPHLDVVGAGRVPDEQYREMARTLGLAERITWHALLSQEELAVLYRRAALHVIPAIGEGLGLTAVESLLCETPVVAFDSGGVPDVVRPGETGELVPPGDSAALAAMLDALLTQPQRREMLGRQGREFALRNFGAGAVADRYAAILRSAAPAARVTW